ncbi:GGDEF domain-containing protein [Aliarcobacter trophiarum]|uniref:GGDEF domain-containing protein n=1 Tax=Aliarcobacter trophiarum TaxID=708186 RepID=UPI0013E932DD|nr:GGDEF domain-containing protein [Aliarcobacter trophiarum]
MNKKLFLLTVLFFIQAINTFVTILLVEINSNSDILSEFISFSVLMLIIYILFERNKDIKSNKIVYLMIFILYFIFVTYYIKYQIEIIFLIYVYILSYYLVNKLNYMKEIKTTNIKLEIMSSIDYLTQVNNRKSIDYFLQENEKIFKQCSNEFSIILIDIDNFKEINDTYGHLIGDKVLIKIAEVLKKYVRDTDIVGRFGGEEFIIICSNTKQEGVKKLAENLRKILLKQDFEILRQVTASFGIASYKDTDNIDELIKRADRALYLAKSKGKNRVEQIL